MKDRVLKYLRELSAEQGDMLQLLADEMDRSPAYIAGRARAIFEAMMTNYGSIAIMTIDKFINRLVRSFSFDLKLESDFRIELNVDAIVEAGVDRLLSKIGIDSDLTRVVEEFALQQIEDEHRQDLRESLLSIGKLTFQENYHAMAERLSAYEPAHYLTLFRKYNTEYRTFQAELMSLGSAGLACIENTRTTDYFSRKSVPSYFKKIAAGDFKEPSDTVLKAFASKEFTTKSASETERSAIAAFEPELSRIFYAVVDLLTGDRFRVLKLKQALARNLFPMAVIQAVDTSIREVQEEGRSRSFAELNRLISEIVKDNPAPFIFERIGEWYHHFLIDEFQDTSIMQWKNFLPLIDHSLAKGKFNLVVGDGKQAIYRWRNGDVRQLQNLPHLLGDLNEMEREREASLIRSAVRENLPANFRSRKNIVAFNNALFEHLPASLPDELRGIYSEHQQIPKGKDGGLITYSHFGTKEVEELHEQILLHVQEAKQNGHKLSDIAILVRTNTEGSKIAKFLMQNGIATITEESLQLGGHPAVLSVIYLMQSIEAGNRDQRAAVQFMQAIAAARPDLVKLGPDMIAYTSLPENRGKGTFHFDRFLQARFPDVSRVTIGGLPLYDMVDKLCAQLGLYNRYEAYCEALLQMALEYQNSESEGLGGFLRFWEMSGKKKSVRVPPTMDGVQLQTVHKSKGLEFPVVIACFFTRAGSPRQQITAELDESLFGLPVGLVDLSAMRDSWAHNQYLEEDARNFVDELNICYVALTRAVDHLHILYTQSANAKDDAGLIPWLSGRLNTIAPNQEQKQEVIVAGDPIVASHEASEVNNLSLQAFKSTTTLSRLQVSVDKEPLSSMNGFLTARSRGNELHALLAEIKAPSDLQLLRKQPVPWQRMSAEQWQLMLDDLSQIVQLLEEKGWFHSKEEVLIERELILADDSEKRPDRIKVGEEIHVLDFKTGETSEDKLPVSSHVKQINLYRDALSQLFPGKPVKATLYYTDVHKWLDIIG
ncbi:MAG: hypothetical protein RL226_640 [Bacteroidota bacterium]